MRDILIKYIDMKHYCRIYILFAILLISQIKIAAGNIPHEIFLDDNLLSEEIVKNNFGDLRTSLVWIGLDSEGEAGCYNLPIKYVHIQVPKYSKNFDVKIIRNVKRRTINLTYPISMVVEQISSNENMFDLKEDRSVSLPEVKICNEYFLNGNDHYIVLRLVPVSYDPERLVVDVYGEFDLDIQFTECKEEELDFALFGNESNTTEISQGRGIIDKSSTPLYAIITTEDLKDSCADLATWKSQKGYRVIVETVGEILNNPEFKINNNDIVDEAAAVRKYLSSLYNAKYDTYCIFVGDKDELPIRYLYNKSSRADDDGSLLYDNFVPTDVYFSDVSQKWDLNYDVAGVYTQSLSKLKYSPCVYVGRLHCSTKTELNNYIEKLKIYEAYPGNGNPTYLSKGFVSQQAQHLGYSNLVEELGTLSEKVIMKDNLADNFDDNRPKGAEVISAMRNCGIISMQGHGGPGTIACSGLNNRGWTWRYIKSINAYDDKQLGFGNQKEENGCGIDNLDNWPNPSVLYSLSCDIMPFDNCYERNINYNIGSAFTVAGKYGGVAVLGNTRTGYDYYNIKLEKEFANKIKVYRNIGKAHAHAKIDANMSQYACAAHNIMGDPELEMWLNTPIEQEVEISFVKDGVRIMGNKLKDSKICLYDGEENNISVIADTNDVSVGVSTNNFDSTDYLVSIWKTGYLPIIKLFGQNSSISNKSKRYIASEATFGKDIVSGKEIGNYTIGSNGVLQIDAIHSLKTHDGFVVGSGGYAELQCINSVNLYGGSVENGGILEVKGNEVILNNGFTVQKGGKLYVEPK